MSQLDAMLTRVHLTLTFDLDLEFSRSNCISGMGGQIVSREWEVQLSWNEMDGSR